jgi:carbon storage regulator
MLVLTRKLSQTIVVDGRIKITVLHVGGSAVRLGIEAPKEVPVLRDELEPFPAESDKQAA